MFGSKGFVSVKKWFDHFVCPMTKSPTTPLVCGGISAFLAGCCWLLQLPKVDTAKWSEKMWYVHRLNHGTGDLCMVAFTLLAALFFAVALYRWIRLGMQRHEKSVL